MSFELFDVKFDGKEDTSTISTLFIRSSRINPFL